MARTGTVAAACRDCTAPPLAGANSSHALIAHAHAMTLNLQAAIFCFVHGLIHMPTLLGLQIFKYQNRSLSACSLSVGANNAYLCRVAWEEVGGKLRTVFAGEILQGSVACTPDDEAAHVIKETEGSGGSAGESDAIDGMRSASQSSFSSHQKGGELDPAGSGEGPQVYVVRGAYVSNTHVVGALLLLLLLFCVPRKELLARAQQCESRLSVSCVSTVDK